MAKVCGNCEINVGALRALFLLISLIICNFYICAANENEKSELYQINSHLKHIGGHDEILSVVKLREKRQTTTDLKNQYESVSQNATDTSQSALNNPPTNQGSNPSSPANIDTSVVVPYTASDRPLLGVNGTGQRKDLPNKDVKPTIVSDPINPATSATGAATTAANATATAKKPLQFPKKVLAATASATPVGGQIVETSPEEDKIFDNFDVSEDETITALKNQNFSVNLTTDYHVYYNSTMYVNKEEADGLWNRIKNTTHNVMLSQSHRRAMTIELSFDFPFYGHPVRNVTVATGGFLYTGEYVHSWLAATQYIAPLMANFDTSLSNESFVRVNDNGTAFTVIWEKVSLQDKQNVGKFTFSATLHKNGDIVFAYFNVPIYVNVIQDDKHPVKVGLSDAYIIDKTVYFTRRKTIYEYHRVNFANEEITNATIIYLKALPTCLGYTDCESCVNHNTPFDCAWCTVINRCSTGTDRKKQEWLQKGCDRTQITDSSVCPALGQRGNNANPGTNNNNNNNNNKNTSSDSSSTNTNENNKSDSSPNTNGDAKANNNSKNSEQSSDINGGGATITPVNIKPNSFGPGTQTKAALEDHAKPKSVGVALGVLVPICLVVTILLWVLYAYRNPHTRSGQLLIQYRPSQWSWRRGEARYTAATIHM